MKERGLGNLSVVIGVAVILVLVLVGGWVYYKSTKPVLLMAPPTCCSGQNDNSCGEGYECETLETYVRCRANTDGRVYGCKIKNCGTYPDCKTGEFCGLTTTNGWTKKCIKDDSTEHCVCGQCLSNSDCPPGFPDLSGRKFCRGNELVWYTCETSLCKRNAINCRALVPPQICKDFPAEGENPAYSNCVPGCATNADCPQDSFVPTVCVDGRCLCEALGGGVGGEICEGNLGTSTCCSSGETCQTNSLGDKVCVDDDCTAEQPYQMNNQCVECLTSNNCGEVDVCVNGKCYTGCNQDNPCTDNDICVNGACAPPCGSNGYCPEGFNCVGGHCQVA